MTTRRFVGRIVTVTDLSETDEESQRPYRQAAHLLVEVGGRAGRELVGRRVAVELLDGGGGIEGEPTR